MANSIFSQYMAGSPYEQQVREQQRQLQRHIDYQQQRGDALQKYTQHGKPLMEQVNEAPNPVLLLLPVI